MSWNLKILSFAALLLIATVGCSTVAQLFDSTKVSETRSQRFLEMAAQYDQQGRSDAAIRIYDHLLAQQPENVLARGRRELLVQRENQTHHDLARSATSSSMLAGKQRGPRKSDTARGVSSGKSSTNLEDELLISEQTRPQGIVSLEERELATTLSQSFGPFSSDEFHETNSLSRAISTNAVIFTEDPVDDITEEKQVSASVYATSSGNRKQEEVWSASLPELYECLKCGDEKIICRSSYQLGQMGVEAAIALPVLYQLQNSSCSVVRIHAAEAILKIAPHHHQSVEVLAKALADEDRNVRWLSVEMLRNAPVEAHAGAARALRIALHDSDPAIRAAACLGLGGFGEHGIPAVDELRDLAEFDDPNVKAAADVSLHCLMPGP